MAESMATSQQHMVESTVAAAPSDEERKLEQLLFAPSYEKALVVAGIDCRQTRSSLMRS